MDLVDDGLDMFCVVVFDFFVVDDVDVFVGVGVEFDGCLCVVWCCVDVDVVVVWYLVFCVLYFVIFYEVLNWVGFGGGFYV